MLDNYTKYELLSKIPMFSKYRFKICELLKSYAFANGHTFDLDDLKKFIGHELY